MLMDKKDEPRLVVDCQPHATRLTALADEIQHSQYLNMYDLTNLIWFCHFLLVLLFGTD